MSELAQAGMVRFVLVGGRENFSGYLGGGGTSKHKFGFSDGVCTLSFQDAERSRRILSFYAAYPEGSQELADAQKAWQEQQHGSTQAPTAEGQVRSDGEGSSEGSAAQGSGHAETETGSAGAVPERDGSERTSRAMTLKDAVAVLDPAKDDHWTQDGAPKLALIQQLCKDKSIKRDEVDAVGVTRESAAT
jgi:hypothetical protein